MFKGQVGPALVRRNLGMDDGNAALRLHISSCQREKKGEVRSVVSEGVHRMFGRQEDCWMSVHCLQPCRLRACTTYHSNIV